MEIRKYRQTDSVTDISRIYALSWKTAYQGLIPQAYLDKIEESRWEHLLIRESDRLLLATDAEKIIGAATYCPARDETFTGWGEVVSLYLLPGYFRKGVGTKLFSACLAELHQLGYQKIYLWVLRDNAAARSFYEKNGFHFNGDVLADEIGGKAVAEIRYIYDDPSCSC